MAYNIDTMFFFFPSDSSKNSLANIRITAMNFKNILSQILPKA